MNPNPSPTPAPTEPAEGQPVVEFVRTQRQTAAYVFLGLSLAFLVATIFLGVRSFRTPTAEKPAETKTADEEKPPELPKAEVADPKKGDYTVGWLATLVGFLITAAAGVYLQVRPPADTPAGQRTEARKVILAAGGLLGFALIIFGGWYFYRWSDSLNNWLDKGEKKEMLWVVVPLLMVAGGAGLVFAAVQPARAEERNNTTLRRLVYGSNFGLTVLLLLVLLVATNVVIAMKVPNQLDTTETGFYTLSDTTKNFLGKLPEPVTMYVIMPDSGDRLSNDIRQFAYSARDAADGKLTLRFVSPVSNQAELTRLQEKYPRLGRDAEGILLTAGADEKRNAFIPFNDLFEIDPATRRPKGFAGEAKVMRELRFLADNEQKPVVYFTQGHGELSITGGAAAEATVSGSASQLKSFLERAYLDVRPLTFPAQNPTVPDDAAVVVVAEPQSALPPAAVGAIRKYMTEPRKGEGKGKLIVLAGAVPGPNDKGVAPTGLEGLLAEFDVRLGDKFIYNNQAERLPARIALVTFNRAAAQNPIYQALKPVIRGAFPFDYAREVTPLTTNPQFQATSLLITYPGRLTWLEPDRVADPNQVIQDLNDNEAARVRKNLTDRPRSVGVVVSEAGSPHGGPGGSGRLLVVGNATVFSDDAVARGRTPPTFDLMSVAIDWLRDRPVLATGVESKVYREYQPPEPAAVDATRLLYLPLGLGMLLVVGLGAGVWVIRRK